MTTTAMNTIYINALLADASYQINGVTNQRGQTPLILLKNIRFSIKAVKGMPFTASVGRMSIALSAVWILDMGLINIGESS